MNFAFARERRAQRLLGAGFPHRAGYRRDLGLRTGSRRAREIAQRFERIGDDEQRRAFGHFGKFLVHHDRERRAALQRIGHELVPVETVALDGEESLADADRAAVDGDAGNVRRGLALKPAAGRGFERVERPERSAHRFPPSAARTAA